MATAELAEPRELAEEPEAGLGKFRGLWFGEAPPREPHLNVS